ncbi:hypothetical protein JI747_000110 [Chryseobacterium sp. RG1]|uniref:Lipoprotein n=1 Tax=Chryseobacterium tagetis TaxID=2801334 RepID=A0ABS7ZV46_9FLAO|nr:hypothetical protein [Chryseobacterium tagetis]MCA6065556.1 hypothetical protein [Chryseobacterium tagetis]
MKKILIACFTAILLTACQSKNDKIRNFVAMYNQSSSMMTNGMIKSTKAIDSGNDQITIEVNTSNEAGDEMQAELMKTSLPELIGQAIKSEPKGRELLDKGVKFNIKIYGVGARVIADEVIDSKNIKGDAGKDLKSISMGSSGPDQLNAVLDIFNKNLPSEDPSTGIKIMSIKADNESNIVYTAQVPESFQKLFQVEGAEQIVKDEMLRSPQIQQIFSKTERLGVKDLIYKYTDANGKNIKEIKITKEDLK